MFLIDNIFLKAVIQPVYCPYYVKFIKLLFKKYKIDKLLDIKCIEYKNVLNETTSKSDEGLTEQEKYDKFCEENKNKVFKDGYTQFIGELFNNNMTKIKVIIENIKFLVENFKILTKTYSNENTENNDLIERILSCLYKLISTTIKNINNKKAITNLITPVVDYKKNLKKKMQFKILDIVELIK